jgi:hypothetical protein
LSDQIPREVGIAIGGLPIAIRSSDAEFIAMLRNRYANFLCDPAGITRTLDVTIVTPAPPTAEVELEVRHDADDWIMNRGDFAARWNPRSRHGIVSQSANPYSIDSALRIIHSLELAATGGFLLHSASAIRNGRAFLFSGISGAGKTTITRLAPADAIRLTDEISYIRRIDGAYHAFGTPFSGELATSGENAVAPIAALYLLRQGDANQIAPLAPENALRRLLRNILFFAHDDELVAQVFRSACDFVAAVPTCELTFRPEPEVWRLVT